jgi:hypothetical protein
MGLPFTVGQIFRKGDVPMGAFVTTDLATSQAVVKNRWPDGSVKLAVISGRADLMPGVPLEVAIQSVAALSSASADLTTADLKKTGVVAGIGFDATSVSWSDADWDSPFRAWIVGPEMSSWLYRKPVGSDPHLVAWLEVRLHAGGAVEVLPWVENGYVLVPAPGNKSGMFSFSLGKDQLFAAAIDLPHHCRTPLLGGAALSFWLGAAADAAPPVTPHHDVAYLQSTTVVPTYRASVSPTAAIVGKLAATFTPLAAGNFNYDSDSMASPGFQEPIGLLPQHDVLYLTCAGNPELTHGAVVRNGFSAGRYAIHYRDEHTNAPIRFSSYPTLNLSPGSSFKDTGGSTTGSYTPKPAGTGAPGWDCAHSPSVGFMAYLITGRFYFLEEAQFATTCNYLGNGDNAALRNGSQGLVQTAVQAWQTRSCAWDWRARVQALCITPDEDTALRQELIDSVEANIEFFHARYVAQPNNPFGWILPGETYNDTTSTGAPWQQEFVTAVFGWSVAMELPISADASKKLAEFFAWKARCAIGLLGTGAAPDWWYVNGFPYNMTISPALVPDYATGSGPWFSTWREAYDATYATPPAWLGSKEGELAFEYIDVPNVGMFANIQPAISYAVQHKVPGAVEAYERMTSASNWTTLVAAFDHSPGWSVAPPTI